jgi:hypothetical protein
MDDPSSWRNLFLLTKFKKMDMSSLLVALGEVGQCGNGQHPSAVSDAEAHRALVDRLLDCISVPTYHAEQFALLRADVGRQLIGMAKDHMLQLVDATERMQVQLSETYARRLELDVQYERLRRATQSE